MIIRGINASLRGKKRTHALAEVCAKNIMGSIYVDPIKHKEVVKKSVEDLTNYFMENYSNEMIEKKTKENWCSTENWIAVTEIMKED